MEEALFQVGRHKLLALFYFTPRTGDPATSERLYHINAMVTPATYEDVAAAVKGQYSEPETEGTEPVRGTTGKTQGARFMAWRDKRGSVVVIKDRVDGLDMGGLAYVDHDLAKAVGGKPQAGESGALPWPFGLRGFNLGTTLGDVRQQKHPDGDYAKFVCSGDPGVTEQFGLTPGSLYRAIGVKTCRFFIFRKSHGDVLEMPMDVDGHPSRAIFLFTPSSWPSATADRLFRIRVVAEPAQFGKLFGALQTRYGKPRIDEMIPQENSKRLSRTLIWEDSRSKLFMSESMPSPWGDRTIIEYLDTALEDAVNKAIEAPKGKSGAGKR